MCPEGRARTAPAFALAPPRAQASDPAVGTHPALGSALAGQDRGRTLGTVPLPPPPNTRVVHIQRATELRSHLESDFGHTVPSFHERRDRVAWL